MADQRAAHCPWPCLGSKTYSTPSQRPPDRSHTLRGGCPDRRGTSTAIAWVEGQTVYSIRGGGPATFTGPPAAALHLPPASPLLHDIKHLVVGRVDGRFKSLEGEFAFADDPERPFDRIDVRIEASSVDTKLEARDEDLRSPASSTWRTSLP
jgi:hypothetical protein